LNLQSSIAPVFSWCCPYACQLRNDGV